MMEVMQFLKHSYNCNLLNFSQDWLVTEEQCFKSDPGETFTISLPQDMHNILTDPESSTARLTSALVAEHDDSSSDLDEYDWGM